MTSAEANKIIERLQRENQDLKDRLAAMVDTARDLTRKVNTQNLYIKELLESGTESVYNEQGATRRHGIRVDTNRLILAMGRAGLTQEETAQKAGLAIGTVGNIISRGTARGKSVIKLAEALNIDADKLIKES